MSIVRRTSIVALCTLSCAAPSRSAPTTAAAVPAGTSARMADHFEASILIKDAIVAGDLRGVRAPALHLREPTDAAPPAWRPFLADNLRYASAALASTTLADAAQAAAGLAATCGGCHAALGAGPHFSAAHPPARAGAHETRRTMARHQWAADRMWEALVQRSDDAWSAGAAALADTPRIERSVTTRTHVAAEVIELDDHVTALARQALAAPDWDTRTRLYGGVLASCAGCHARVL